MPFLDGVMIFFRLIRRRDCESLGWGADAQELVANAPQRGRARERRRFYRMTIENRETSLKANYKVYCAVTAILGANASVATAAAPADAAPAGSDEGSLAISEVTVTAQRRTENVQNV